MTYGRDNVYGTYRFSYFGERFTTYGFNFPFFRVLRGRGFASLLFFVFREEYGDGGFDLRYTYLLGLLLFAPLLAI